MSQNWQKDLEKREENDKNKNETTNTQVCLTTFYQVNIHMLPEIEHSTDMCVLQVPYDTTTLKKN